MQHNSMFLRLGWVHILLSLFEVGLYLRQLSITPSLNLRKKFRVLPNLQPVNNLCIYLHNYCFLLHICSSIDETTNTINNINENYSIEWSNIGNLVCILLLLCKG